MDPPLECTCHCGRLIPLKLAVRCSKSAQCHDYYSIYCHTEGCNSRFCDFHDGTCWDDHLPRGKQAKLHSPVGISVQHLFIQNVFHSEHDVERLRQLHEQDAKARWFNIRHRSAQPVLSVYDRFGPLCGSLSGGDSNAASKFPSFVSFIGKSGVGKSTLARAMLLLGNRKIHQRPAGGEGVDVATSQSNIERFTSALSSQAEIPVTRSGHTDHAADPTTLGVHLYKDGGSGMQDSQEQSDDFMLFADCEGFFAGATQTNAERLTAPQGEPSMEEPQSTSNLLYSEPVTAPSYSQKGQGGAELFYARFLYAISDVIVFVTNEDQNFAHLLVSILEWAAAAVPHSVNYPSRKTLIIVRNGALKHSQAMSDESFLKKLYLDRRSILWEESNSSILKEFVKDYNNKHDDAYSSHIYSNERLYNVLFDKIECCCIPNIKDVEDNSDETMFNQFLRLRTQIEDASAEARSLRSTGWMKYNVSSLSQILFSAFEHFRTSDEPFDFNEVARIGKPNPQSFSNHIANFLRLALESTPPSSSPDEKALAMITDIIALSFAVWSMRTLFRVVDPEHLFDVDSTSENGTMSMAKCCRLALQEYDEKYQKCGHKFSGNELCTNGPAATHRRLHLSSTTKRQAEGDFVPRYSYDSDLTGMVRERFLEQYKSLVMEDRTETHSMTKPVAGKIRRVRESIMQKYAPHWRAITSNTTCLGCLQKVPENVLRCGHAFCVECVRELGKEADTFESAWIFEVCPLCYKKTGENYSHLIRMKPRCAGARIVTLDGGGIRGIMELALIREIERRLALDIPFRDYFDLMIGTSTGGIVALAVAMGDENGDTHATTLTKAFTSFASKTFAHPCAGPLWSSIGLGHFVTSMVMAIRWYRSLFDSAPLESGLKAFFGENTSLFGSARTRKHQCPTRVAVIATKDCGDRPCLISSYNRPSVMSGGDFEREDDERKAMKIWEAGLATSAAPLYLPPFKKVETNTEYFDGALHLNCPAPEAWEEMSKLWPDGSASLDFLLSMGTGKQESEVKVPKVIRIRGVTEICRSFHSKLDSENQWQEFYRSAALAHVRDRLHRLNPVIDRDLQKVALWQWEKMAKLDAMVARQMKEPEWKTRIDNLTYTLLASLIYFEPDPSEPLSASSLTPAGTRHFNMDVAIKGTVRSRLRHHSIELTGLLDKLSGLFYTTISTWSSHRFHYSQVQPDRWVEIKEFASVRDRVKQSPFRVPVCLKSSESELLVLAVRFKGSASTVAISGFPAHLNDLHNKARLWD